MKSDETYYQEIEKAKLQLVTVLNHSYFNQWLIFTKIGLDDEKVPTAGVCFRHDFKYELLVNRGFWDTLTFNQQVGLIQHEIYHLVFGHTIPKRFNLDKDPKILNIAMDIAINQYIRPENMPPGACLPVTFGFSEGLSTMEYYDLLMQNVKKIKGKAGSGGDGGEEELGYAAGGNHFSSEVQEENLEEQLHAENSAKIYKSCSYGKLPAELERNIMEALTPFKLDWKQLLKQFLSSVQADFKFKRKYNKKAEFDPTRVHKRKKFKKKTLVAIDVSGSIDAESLKLFFNEINGIYEEGTITVLSCDTKIHDIFEYDGNPPVSLKGGGGTNMQPVCDYMEEHNYDVLIVFTDGYFADVKCSGSSLWVTTCTDEFKVEGPSTIVKF